MTALALSVPNRGANATVEDVGDAKLEQCLSLIEDQKVNPKHYALLESWLAVLVKEKDWSVLLILQHAQALAVDSTTPQHYLAMEVNKRFNFLKDVLLSISDHTLEFFNGTSVNLNEAMTENDYIASLASLCGGGSDEDKIGMQRQLLDAYNNVAQREGVGTLTLEEDQLGNNGAGASETTTVNWVMMDLQIVHSVNVVMTKIPILHPVKMMVLPVK